MHSFVGALEREHFHGHTLKGQEMFTTRADVFQAIQQKRRQNPELTMMESLLELLDETYESGRSAGWKEGWDHGFADGYHHEDHKRD